MENSALIEWSSNDIKSYLKKEGFQQKSICLLCDDNKINGKSMLALNDSDFSLPPLINLNLHDRKLLYILTKCFQKSNRGALHELGLIPESASTSSRNTSNYFYNDRNHNNNSEYSSINSIISNNSLHRHHSQNERPNKIKLPPEKTKAFLSFCYVVAVTWITAFVMVIVHDRVPDMKKYPPLPDIFLDNVPHIPWAFDMCEVTGTLMFTIWLIVLLFHKYRFILMRRFFALSGTVFLLRCITMLITSLSVPGTHLQCEPRNFSIHGISSFDELANKLSQAYVIWRGAGMSIQGVRTCGDYMFSGHTVALTMLNFFITEYTPRHIYYLHILSWMMNMFGIFFILAAHEHYSIDVFVAFYITSRLFLYYHTLSNNQTLMQRDSTRTKVWFPLFSYFESSVKGIVPNEYETPAQIAKNFICFIKDIFCDVVKSVLELFRKDDNNSNLIVNSSNNNSSSPTNSSTNTKKDR